MSTYLPAGCRTWRYRFRWNKQWHVGTTGQLTKEDADLVEAKIKLRVRREAYGIAPFDPSRSPRFSDWAEVYYKDVTTRRRTRIRRPERIADLLRVILRFWGRRPRNPKAEDVGPFHDLRLIDPIADPQWIVRFEHWMDARGISGQTKNQYRSVLSQMFKLAAAPEWRKVTGVEQNPFRDLERDPKVTRTVTTSLEDLRKILATAAYHIRLAIAIGLLAHKLRLDNILSLTWKEHILELGPRELANGQTVYGWIKVGEDDSKNRRPLVVPVSAQLFGILQDARSRATSEYVVSYRGRRVGDIRNGLKNICRRVGVPYGRFVANGVTFHTLRHTSSTALAEIDIPEPKRRQASGHASARALDGYTHLRPVAEIHTREQLSQAFPIADLVMAKARMVPDHRPDHTAPTDAQNAQQIRPSPAMQRHMARFANRRQGKS